MPVRHCPTMQELKAFVLGELAEDRCDDVCAHLEGCSKCETLIQRIDEQDDELIQVLRQGEVLNRSRSSDDTAVTFTRGPARSEPKAQPLQQVAGYTLLGELGRGGMGIVYKARQNRLGRLVALKMILHGRHADASELVRFRAEAEAIARLQHPNIVQVYEIGDHEGQPFFSLEYCPHGSLSQRLK